MPRRTLPTTAEVIGGVEMKVYQARSYGAQPGAWHGHVSLPRGWRNYFRGWSCA